MMPRQLLATALLLLLMAAIGVSQQQKSVTEVPLIICYAPQPTTLDQMTALVHAIVRARVIGSQFRDLGRPDQAFSDVNTAYSLNVLEVLKRDSHLPAPTEVLRAGGDLETEQGIRRFVETDFPPFELGDEYLLFLSWNESLATYQMTFGVDGAYRITPDNRLHRMGGGVLALRYTGQDAREVANRIREIAAAKRDK